MAARFARNDGGDGRDRLAKIGEEGFALIDDQLNVGNRLHRPDKGPHAAPFHQELQYRHHQYQYQQQSCVYHGPQAVTVKQEPVITSEYQDRHRQNFHRQCQHHRSYYVSYEPRVFTVKQQPAITSDEAAELLGGTVVVDHRTKYGYN